MKRGRTGIVLGVAGAVGLFPLRAFALDSSGLLDKALERFHQNASGWSQFLMAQASYLFWSLVLISIVVHCFKWKSDIGEHLTELLRFVIVTGFHWWILYNAPQICTSIYESMLTMGSKASGLPAAMSPSSIIDVGFEIFAAVIDMSVAYRPVDTAVTITMAFLILLCLGSTAINMLLTLLSGWMLAYGGIFLLGFGGSRWTSDIAINYYKTVLSIGAQLLGMALAVGIGRTFLLDHHLEMASDITFKNLGAMLLVSLLLMRLVNKIPELLGGIVGGAALRGGGGDAGAVTALGAATMASAAMSTGVKGLMQGGLAMAGGASAVAAAVAKASELVGASELAPTVSAGASNGAASSSSGETPLAGAAGFGPGTASAGGRAEQGASGGAASAPGSQQESEDTGAAGGARASGSAEAERQQGASSAGASSPRGDGDAQAPESAGPDQSAVSAATGSADTGGTEATAGTGQEIQKQGLDAKEGAGVGGEEKRAMPLSARKSAARIAGTAASLLATTGYGMAKGAAVGLARNTLDQVGKTAGGRLAAAIREHGTNTGGSLSGEGDADEVQAFVKGDDACP